MSVSTPISTSSITYGESNDEDDTNRSSHSDNLPVEANSTEYRPRFFRYIPRLFRFENSVKATAIAVNTYARAMILMASVFIGPALLELAKEQAVSDCEQDGNSTSDCLATGRVHGFLPSSLLTNIATVAGLVSAVILPPTGAIIDHTSYRRSIGFYSCLGMSMFKFVEIWISSKTWFIMAWLQMMSAIFMQISAVTEYAYSAELTRCPQEQSKYQSYFFFVMFISFIIYMLQVLIPGKMYALDNVRTARLGTLLASVWTIPLFVLTWVYLFPKRKSLRQVPPDQTLWTAGFRKLYQTFQTIRSSLPAVFWFLLSVMCSGSANWSINTIAITFFSEYLKLPSQEIGLVIFTILLGGIPGTFIGKYVSMKFNPVVSCKICLVFFIILICAASIGLSPSTKDFAFLFGFFLGLLKGWLHPMQTALYFTIIPKGQEAEMMGVYLFCNYIFAFLPPLFFTLLNEQGLSMRWGMASINAFFALGLLFLYQIKDYEEAIYQGDVITKEQSEDENLVVVSDDIID